MDNIVLFYDKNAGKCVKGKVTYYENWYEEWKLGIGNGEIISIEFEDGDKVVCDENHKKVTKKHGKFNTLQEAKQSVLDWWKQNNFEPPYVRETQDENEVWWDYGSHVCFYHFVRVDE